MNNMSQPGSLPTANDFFGTKPQGGGALPSADEFFAPPVSSVMSSVGSSIAQPLQSGAAFGPLGKLTRGALDFGAAAYHDISAGDVHSSPALDAYFSQGSVGRILNAFGQNAAQGWGAPILLSPENEARLRKYGVFNDYSSGHTTVNHAVNEAFMRPLAASLDAVLRAGVAIPRGIAGALQEVSRQNLDSPVGAVTGAAGEIAGSIPEGFLPEVGGPHFSEGSPAPVDAARIEPTFGPLTSATITQARALGVIGEGEEGYFGTKQPTPETAAARATAIRQQIEAETAQGTPEQSEAPIGAPSEAPATNAPGAPTDIHTVARQIDPETFQSYDALAARQDTFRRWLGELGQVRDTDPRLASAQSEIDTILGKVNGVEDRLTNKAAARLDAVRDEMDDFRSKDTADMARIREALQANDYKMRDIAPQVAAAYRAAQDRIGTVEPEHPTATPQPEDAAPPSPVPEGAPASEASTGTAPATEPTQPVSFKTAKGITYQVHEDGTTTRNKAARSDAGHEGDSGAKARTVKTVYVDTPEHASQLSAAGLQGLGPKGARVIIKDGKASLLTWNERAGKWGISPGQRDISVSSEPGVGKAPLELWKPADDVPGHEAYANMHAGNAITEMSGGTASVDIVTDVSRKLIAAGRPAEEANAAAQIVADHYAARASRLRGATADDLYRADAPEIKAGQRRGAKAPEMAQRKSGSINIRQARTTIRLFENADASTAMHEFGHQWLEELMSDAADERANDAVRMDASTVRDWLGVKDGETIPTKAHEKFARGFERYLMEGRAPSQALASVFAKFKAWLTQIYQTVQKLRSPINDDIRDVFDRLVTANPDARTTIAEDATEAKSLADTHEELAETTAPEQAATVADKVRSEIDAHASKADPEIARELNPNGSQQPVAGEPAADAGAASGGAEAEPATGEDGTSAEPGAVAEGGNETAPKGGSTPEPTNANERFAEYESPLVDKAGNIRLDNLSTPEDVSEVIRDTAKGHNDFITARRGKLSDGEIEDLADAIGMDAYKLNARKIGQAFNAEQIVAARKLLIKSASDVRDKMSMAATGTDADVIAYAEAKTRHNMIQEQVAGLTAEAGRALQAFRKLGGSAEAKAVGDFLKDATGRTLNQLRMEAKLGAALQTPAQVSRFAQMTNWAKARAAILEYYVNCLISGPVTHFRYAVGNAINAIVAGGVDTPIAAGIGALKQGLWLVDKGDRVYLGEAGAQLFAITKGSRDGFRAGYEAFRTGVSPTLPGERATEMWGAQRAIPGKAGEIINIPSKSVSAIHSFFKSLRYEQNMQALAYRTATKEGLSGSAFDNRVSDLTLTPSSEMMDAWEDRESYDELETALAARDIARQEGLSGDALYSRIESLITTPTPEIKAALDAGTNTETARIIAENSVAATRESLRELYLAPTKYGTTAALMNRVVNSNIITKILIPFMKIGLQITHNAFMERTVLGFTDKGIRDNALGKNGGAAQDMQLARFATGTAVIGITTIMAAEGLATGDGPEDPNQRAAWLLTHKPNTITIGDISLPYQGLGSLGMLMRFSANMHQTYSMLGEETDGKIALTALEGISKSVLDETFLRGMKDALDAMYHFQEYGPSFIKGFIANWLPYSVGMSQVARQIDPYQRETKETDFWDGLSDTIKAKTPFLSQDLMPRRDMFGEAIPQSGTLQTYDSDPVVEEMDALGFGIGRPERKIRGIPLTNEQYDDFSRIAGRLTKMQLNGIVAVPGFSSFPAETRMDMMKSAITDARETARSLIMMQSMGGPNDLVRAGLAAKTAGLSTP